MSIPYRHKRTLQRIGTVALFLTCILLVAWLCWVIWLQRYVVYTSNGAHLDFDVSSYEVEGQVAKPKEAEHNISIYYNEGANAIDTSKEMTQISGYYITSDMFQQHMADFLLQVERLPAGTPVMIDMKGPYGSFFYQTQLPNGVVSASTDIQGVADLMTKMKMKGFYMIARVSAFRDREFGNNNVASGLYMLNRRGLWMDTGGMFWLDPTSPTAPNWIAAVVLELKSMGFDEVVLDNFRFPASDQYIFNGDKPAALQAAAKTLMSACESNDFVLSFVVEDPAFQLPEGRCRMYLTGVDAGSAAQKASLVTFEDPQVRLAFLSETGDTRYDQFSVLRSIEVAEEVEARKGN